MSAKYMVSNNTPILAFFSFDVSCCGVAWELKYKATKGQLQTYGHKAGVVTETPTLPYLLSIFITKMHFSFLGVRKKRENLWL